MYIIKHINEINTQIQGQSTQASTPTPVNPVPITNTVKYKTNGERVELRGLEGIKDVYNPATGILTRNVGILILDGTETWSKHATYSLFTCGISGALISRGAPACICNYYSGIKPTIGAGSVYNNEIKMGYYSTSVVSTLYARDDRFTVKTDWADFLVEKYAENNPVTIYYPLSVPTTEDVGQLYDEPVYYGDIYHYVGGVIDSGIQSWIYTEPTSTYPNGYFRITVSDKKYGQLSGMALEGYILQVGTYDKDKSIWGNNSASTVFLTDSRFNNTTDLKAFLNGKDLFYQRTTDETWDPPAHYMLKGAD